MHIHIGRALVLGLCLVAGAAVAEPATDGILSLLQKQGYSEFRVSRTILGRVRIVAKSKENEREIVLNPRTGEVLRDLWTEVDETGTRRNGLIALGSTKSDKSDDDNSDKDNSGHGNSDDSGSDNSGHGNSDDSGDSGDSGGDSGDSGDSGGDSGDSGDSGGDSGDSGDD